MLNKKKAIITISSVLALALLASPVLIKSADAYPQNAKRNAAQAQSLKDSPSKRGMERGGRGQQHKNFIDTLSADERTLYRDMVEKYNDDVAEWKVELATKRATYHALMNSTNPKPSEAGKLAGEIEVLNQKLQKENSKFRAEVDAKFGTRKK